MERDRGGFVAHTVAGSCHFGEQLLVCCGAWSGRLAALFGEDVPLEARGPQMGVTEPLPYAVGPSIGISSPIESEGLYFRQIRRGNVVFGGGLKGPALPGPIRAYVKPDNTLRQLRELRRFVPAFAHGLEFLRRPARRQRSSSASPTKSQRSSGSTTSKNASTRWERFRSVAHRRSSNCFSLARRPSGAK